MQASVIIPVYNQYPSLCKVLIGFDQQVIDKQKFELIIIDDGSTDEMATADAAVIQQYYSGSNITEYHSENAGRAAARNRGIEKAKSDILIFCDGDRVPHKEFVSTHISQQQAGRGIIVGIQYDYFGPHPLLCKNPIDWNGINRFSKHPAYHKSINRIYDAEGRTESSLSWLSFLVGNSSISKDLLLKTGGFDEMFVEWGFEHFELAYRLQEEGNAFCLSRDAVNYHLPHSREQGFYLNCIEKNIKLIKQKHPKIMKGEYIMDIVMRNYDPKLIEEKIKQELSI